MHGLLYLFLSSLSSNLSRYVNIFKRIVSVYNTACSRQFYASCTFKLELLVQFSFLWSGSTFRFFISHQRGVDVLIIRLVSHPGGHFGKPVELKVNRTHNLNSIEGKFWMKQSIASGAMIIRKFWLIFWNCDIYSKQLSRSLQSLGRFPLTLALTAMCIEHMLLMFSTILWLSN